MSSDPITDTPSAPRLLDRRNTALHFQVNPATIDNWLSRGYIKAYRLDFSRSLFYDLDEIERALKLRGSKMRDGRRRGTKGQVVRLITAKVSAE
ncbi:hypothetical protein KZX37_08295 [Microbacterium sp. EYE_5]|uniref:hypothetical protein n=1 Tax=unclassified Microbacterium TaxID=2609290 RepID=UPI0020051F8F|nr:MULTISPECIES: hypothetical protein [unclassified Microbacterium]MCK6081486.1 hypothetical protein [Microbacterium sp. EYE_382]MCK6086756.1 hypothetical protein [Microbacterium sp. EYE_384]MCK6123746.1 hypothetical protein [Microbacterium sp. EYE_80]MCK6126655.1 hypothetical protein [Microbacterium sp. EYE_79]MCK6142441.1 hypothetical protein [Microbacterium sp. EYE_39]